MKDLLKEAIADAKAVRETALANAKLALEEAFTPRLQSMLSAKLAEEMSEEDEEMPAEEEMPTEGEDMEDEGMPAEEPVEEGEGEEMPEEEMTEEDMDMEGEGEDDLDLESIIRELEAQIAGEEGEEAHIEEPAMEGDEAPEMEVPAEEPAMESEEAPADDEEIDLDEILREMGYGDEPAEEAPVATEEEHSEEELDALKAELKSVQSELGEAISVIKSLKGTINEVNLLNAKLLYVNKLFRSFNLTNEQKSKVVETLDRTKNVREVKLVFSTIAESFKFGTGATKKVTAKLTESYASKPAASTAPKQIISEDNSAALRFKKLAGIIK